MSALPRLKVPLAEGDPDTTLDLQAALEQVYVDGRYYRRIRYDQKCKPRLTPQNQAWADQQMSAYRAAQSGFFHAERCSVTRPDCRRHGIAIFRITRGGERSTT